MRKKLIWLFSVMIIASMVLGACAKKAEETTEAPAGEELAVGIVLPTKDEPRWIQDETRFKDALGKAGYAVEILFSQGDSAKEKENVEALITKGVKVLIICPQDSTAAAAAAEAARTAGVKVVSYDRLITDTDAVDYYVTFDSIAVGEAQAQYLVDKATGTGLPLYLYAGAASDNNAFLFFEGAWNKLQPKIADGTFVIKNSAEAIALQDKATLTRDEMGKIIGQITTNWDFNVAKNLAESNLTATTAADKGEVFILAPNDGTARAIADAFGADKDVTKYWVTGQDAEIASVQYIIDGKQSMTVLKDVRTLVSDAIAAAVAFLEGKTPAQTHTYNNGVIEVPAKPSAVVSVDQANVKAAIVDSGYYTADKFTGLAEGEAPVTTESKWEGVVPAKEIVFWHQHSGSRGEELQKVVDSFNATNEYGITLTAEYAGGYGDIFTKMLPILNTPDVPDVVVGYQNQTATYQLAGAMFDMNEIINDPVYGMPAEDQADFFPGFFAQDVFSIYDGARLGLPPNRSMEMVYYNQTWLEELGFAGPPSTPAEFKEMACAATATPFSAATAEGSLGYQLSIDTSRFASWTFAFGGDIFDYDANQFTLNSAASIEAMEFLQDLFESGCAAIPAEAYGDQTDFGNGTLLFTVSSSSGLPYYKSAVDSGAAHAWSVAALPNTGVIKQNVYGASVGIPKSTPERELAAWIWLKYYTSPGPQSEWAKFSMYFPTRMSVAEDMTAFFMANPPYKTAFDLLEYGAFEPPVPGYDFIRDEIELTMAALMEDTTLDVTEELNKLNDIANEILADQLAQIQQ